MEIPANIKSKPTRISTSQALTPGCKMMIAVASNRSNIPFTSSQPQFLASGFGERQRQSDRGDTIDREIGPSTRVRDTNPPIGQANIPRRL